MSYYQENRPTMGGLADALAMQGRRGDSTLVHMNPMEVRMLEAMSPDGRLSVNPETGLPEAFKLKDILGVALPIAGGALLGPAIAPGLIGTAIGTGIGGLGAGLVQGKGVGDSLIQGGLSGLMSYGLGSLSGAFAPSGGVTAATPDLGTGISDSLTGAAIDPNMELVAGLGSSTGTTAAAAEAPSLFTQLGNMASTPVMPETMSSVLGPEKLAAAQFAEAMPTYGSLAGSGASGLLSSALLAPEEMPYDIAGMDDMDAYYSRVPDLEAGRRRGRSAARQLQSPPSFLTSGGLYERAISPGGGGTFFAADGGQVPKPYGDPYGPGDPYGGMADEADVGQSSSTGPGISLGSFNEPVADLGLGSFNPTPMSLGLTALGMVPGPVGIMANIANIGRGLVGLMGPSVPGQVSGFGTTTGGPTGIGIGVTGQAVDPNFEAVSDPNFDMQFDFNPSIGDPTGVSGDTSGASDTASTAGAVGDAAGESTADQGTFAQGGGISSLAYGGEAAPVGFANKAFEGMVPGPGTGMSDDVPFSIEGNQPALLSRDEYVLPADVVSQLGDGSSSAGADMLDNFISQVRQTKYGNTQQPAPVGPQLMTGLMRQGGVV